MAVLIDRVPNKPGRRLITPENGAPYYAKIEMADEPAVVGTPVNRQNVIDTARAAQKQEITRISESGVWVCPVGVHEIDVYLVGGGAGGHESVTGPGGSGGYCRLQRSVPVEPHGEYTIQIGAGGNAGQDGGDTIAFGVTAKGGKAAISTEIGIVSGPGGSGGGGGAQDVKSGNGGSAGGPGEYRAGGDGGLNIDYTPVNPYDGIAYGCGGGAGGYRYGDGGNGGGAGGHGAGVSRPASPAGIGGGGGGAYNGGAQHDDAPGTNGGAGGGGGGGGNGNGGAGRGGDGLVIIYGAEV